MDTLLAGMRRKAEETRARLVGKIPPEYNPWLHLAATTGVGVGALGLGLWAVGPLKAAELAVIPLTVVVANGTEWWAHKVLLHRRTWPMELLYDRHTPEHHAVYHDGAMEVQSYRELKLVLMPAIGVLGAVVATAPLSAAFGALFSANAGWVFLTTAACYLVSYELLHTAYHLPKEHPISKNPLIRWLSKHHAKHHDPRLMRSWNFNVTLPLFDWLMGTIAKEDAPVEAAKEQEVVAAN